MTVLFAVTAIILFIIGSRLSQRGRWLPQPPLEIGQWTGSEMPLARSAVEQLGSPKTIGFAYRNLFLDEVDVHIIAANSFEAYLDPRTTMARFSYGMTAQKELPLFGKDGSARGLVFRSPDIGEARVLMYYWVQYRDGRANPGETLQQSDDFLPRLHLGTAASVQGTENCVVRVFTRINPDDRDGIQAHRDIEEICLALHEALKAQGKMGAVK
jgi:hypothetical protein